MKTKANILIEDGQDIKVESVITDFISSSDGKRLLDYDKNSNTFGLIGDAEIDDVFIYALEDFVIHSSTHGGFQLNGNGLVFAVYNGVHLSDTQFSFSPYTTALRPTSASEGAVIYDSTLKKCILYNGTDWVNLDGTALS